MTQQHPITPLPELVEQWCEQLFGCPDKPEIAAYELVRLGAQWGADQELEACCALLELSDSNARDFLQSARRPKPPSLKQQALAAAAELEGFKGVDIIRRALEALPDPS